ncbi:MAG: UDP-N-acetylmuramoyl-tripeptide--D-alanyl-D-alanine ligase, partial [Acidobacteriota bacterium]
MAALDLDTVAKATGGTVVQGDPSLKVARYAIDSRRIAGGELFFALQGPHHDGHRFLGEACRRGAAAAVVSRPGPAAPLPQVKVDDTSTALRDLARSVRQAWQGTVIGITGSCGKTTTKEMLKLVLQGSRPLLATPGNLNNLFGLPLVLLDLLPAHQVAVLEMGISTPGEMTDLAAIACPDVAVILNVQPVHLEQFDSLEALARAKLEILNSLNPEGTVVYNADDPLLAAGIQCRAGRRISFGTSARADLSAEAIEIAGSESLKARLRAPGSQADLHLPVGGRHNLANALAALAAALAVGLPLETGCKRLQTFTPPPMRGVRHHLPGNVIIWDDTYN